MQTSDFTEPDDATVGHAVAAFARAVSDAYGNRLKGIYLFGSRARGDHTPESDADIAVILADDGWDAWAERVRLVDMTYDILIETGADLQPWPIRESEWRDPSVHRNPGLVRNMRADALPIEN